jgi:flavin reductase (DIM6/NTAB) family NADH-FMN oxidoreductase RutF
VVPRPVAWISTINEDGVVNLAPFSYFNAVSDIPPIIMFAASLNEEGNIKDTRRNIEANGEFVVNLVNYDLRDKMNLTSSFLAFGISEAEKFDIEMTESNLVSVSRVKLSPISLECKLIKIESLFVEDKEASASVVYGHVIGIHIDDKIIEDGKVDITKFLPIARLGYDEYAKIESVFKMKRI